MKAVKFWNWIFTEVILFYISSSMEDSIAK